MKKNFCFGLLLALILGLSTLPTRAITVTQSDELRLNPSKTAQAISFSLSDVPRRSNGRVRRGNLSLRFAFDSREDRRRFSLRPRNGRVRIRVGRDGTIRPGKLIVRARDPESITENETFDYTLRTSSRTKRRANIDSDLKGSLSYRAKNLEAIVQVLVPPGNLAQFSEAESSLGSGVKAVELTPPPAPRISSQLIAPVAPGSATRELSVVVTNFDVEQGLFKVNWDDPEIDEASNVTCQVTGNNPEDPNNILRAPVVFDNGIPGVDFIIDPISEFYSRSIYDNPNVDLSAITLPEIEAINKTIRDLNLEPANTLNDSFTEFEQKAAEFLDTAVNNANSDPGDKKPIDKPKQYQVNVFRLTRDLDLVDPIQSIFGLQTGVAAETYRLDFGQPQNGIFTINGNQTSSNAVVGARELNGNNPPIPSQQVPSNDQPVLPEFIKGTSNGQKISTFDTSGSISFPNLDSAVSAVNTEVSEDKTSLASNSSGTILVGNSSPKRTTEKDSSGQMIKDKVSTSKLLAFENGDVANADDVNKNFTGTENESGLGMITYGVSIDDTNQIKINSSLATCFVDESGQLVCEGDKSCMQSNLNSGFGVNTTVNPGTYTGTVVNGDSAGTIKIEDRNANKNNGNNLINGDVNAVAGDKGNLLNGFANGDVGDAKEVTENFVVLRSDVGENTFGGEAAKYCVYGNFWIHDSTPFSFKFRAESSEYEFRNNFVTKGNIFIADNVTFENLEKDAVAFIPVRNQKDLPEESSQITTGSKGEVTFDFPGLNQNHSCYFGQANDYFVCQVVDFDSQNETVGIVFGVKQEDKGQN